MNVNLWHKNSIISITYYTDTPDSSQTQIYAYTFILLSFKPY